MKAIEFLQSKNLGATTRLSVLEVDRDSSYRFHQAHVRRAGFLAAQNDRILTLDADDIPNANALDAIRKVGNDGFGFVSVSRFHYPMELTRFWRALALCVVRFGSKLLRHPMFYWCSGVYALYRPFWLQTDDLENVRGMRDPKHDTLQGAMLGEDTHLHVSMKAKFRVSYLSLIGAVSMRDQHEDDPGVQYKRGLYTGVTKPDSLRWFRWCLTEMFCLAHANYVRGFFAGRRLRKRWENVKSS
jgi:hypothetical protein